jgi:CheY-like chemotaxis protein
MTDNNPIVLCIAAEQLSLAVRGLVLQSEGYRVVSASNFEDAMRFGTLNHPDLIICEQPLGKESGLVLAEALKQVLPSTPILLIRGVMEPVPQTLSVDAMMTKIDGPEAFLRNVAALLNASPAGDRAA